MQVFAALLVRDYSVALPEQDLTLKFDSLPPVPADGLRAVVEQLEVLDKQTSKLGRLVDELLDVSRIESGRVSDFSSNCRRMRRSGPSA